MAARKVKSAPPFMARNLINSSASAQTTMGKTEMAASSAQNFLVILEKQRCVSSSLDEV